MSAKTEEKEIGGKVYIVTQFGALEGRSVLVCLTRMVGPAMSGLVKGGLGEDGIAAALTAWSEHASEKDFGYLCDTFAKYTKVRIPSTLETPIHLELSKVFDTHFAGAYAEMLMWLAFAIGVNYGSFLDGIRNEAKGLLASVGIRTQPVSKSPPE